jgi:plastocyanin
MRNRAALVQHAWSAVLVATLAVAACVLTACTSSALGTSTPVTPAQTAAASSSAPAKAVSAPTSAAGGNNAASTCSPSGTSLTISAKNIKFSKSCLAAPAGKAFTITFDNMDSGVPHNIDIFTNKSATKSLFKGATITGSKTTTYKVPALKAGTYYFRCDIHPTQMFGTFVVS